MTSLKIENDWMIIEDDKNESMSKVVQEFKIKYCHPICENKNNCKYFQSKKVVLDPMKPLLFRQTQNACLNCGSLPVSLYEHKFCHRCATKDNVEEFKYHHQHCGK